jgi:hypothetical protein
MSKKKKKEQVVNDNAPKYCDVAPKECDGSCGCRNKKGSN